MFLVLSLSGISGNGLVRQSKNVGNKEREGETPTLEKGKPVERELVGGQAHYYKIMVEAGQYLSLIVDQNGIDVVATLLDPADKKLLEVDSPNGTQGPEFVSIIVDTTSNYTLEVRSLEKEAPVGHYKVEITDLRMATVKDRSHILAEKTLAEGMALERQEKEESIKGAMQKYEEAMKLFKASEYLQSAGTTLRRLGVLSRRLGLQQQALDYYNQALLLLRSVGDRSGEAMTLNNIGTVYISLGEQRKALDYFNQAMMISRAIGDRNGDASMLHNIGAAYEALGELQKALEHYNQALAIRRSMGDRSGEANAINNIGSIYNLLGEPQKALEYYNQALPLRRLVGDRRGEVVTINNIGAVYQSLDEKEKALDYYNQALTLCRSIVDRAAEAEILNSIGSIYDLFWEKQEALERYHQALAIRRAVSDRRGEARTLNNIGLVYDSLGERQRSLDYYNQALAIRQAVNDRRGEAVTLNNIGAVYNSLRERQKALDHYQQALTIRRAIGDRRGEAQTLNNIDAIYYLFGEKQKALEGYNQALLLWRAIGNRSGEASTLNNIGAVYHALGAKQEALTCYNQALLLSRALSNRDNEVTALVGIAKAEAAQGKLLEARSAIESALHIIESLRMKVIGHELRSSYFETTQDYYEFSIDLLMQLHRLHPNEGYDRAALQAAERSRARSLLEGLAEAHPGILRGADPALVKHKRALQLLLNAKTERQMRLLEGKYTDAQAEAVANEIKALIAQYQDVEVEIRAKSPRYAALTQPQPLDPAQIQQEVLDDQTVLLEYFLGKDRSYLWVVSPNSIRSYELPKRAEVEEASLRVKKLLTSRGIREGGESPERWRARIIKAEAAYWVEAARLSRMILGPAISELCGKRLAIVPDGELQDVAFGALPTPRAAEDGEDKATNRKLSQNGDWLPLIVEHEIVSLPSASVLAILQRETVGRQPAAKTVAVLADPVFDKNDERFKLVNTTKPAIGSGPETEAINNNSLRQSAKEAIGVENPFSRLPFSRKEAEAILSMAPRETSLKALDFNANRTIATSEELSQYRIVHFATHGLLNKVYPELSGVALSFVDQQGNPQNGFLQLHDIYNLNLSAELVVLSACQTGLGKAVRGEGLVGLTHGFMYAGARRVVASLWEVRDFATVELMRRFYGAMLGEKQMRPAEALRTAQIEMWKHKRWQSPYYWGGFMLYGEWN